METMSYGMLCTPLALKFTYFNFAPLYSGSLSGMSLPLQNTVYSTSSEQLSPIIFSTSVSNPPYFAGTPCVPNIATLFIISNRLHFYNSNCPMLSTICCELYFLECSSELLHKVTYNSLFDKTFLTISSIFSIS